MPSALRIGGLVPLTTVDFPGLLAAVVFCQGCPWRCRYCHNSHLQDFSEGNPDLTWEKILDFLTARRGFLEAVVFSGGEPTAQPEITAAAAAVRELGFKVGLHTAGIFPHRLRALLPFVDWVGLDIKAPFDHRYDRVVQRFRSAEVAEASLRILVASHVSFQLRTTVHPRLLGPRDRDDLERDLVLRGAPPTVWQPFQPHGCVDEDLVATSLDS